MTFAGYGRKVLVVKSKTLCIAWVVGPAMWAWLAVDPLRSAPSLESDPLMAKLVAISNWTGRICYSITEKSEENNRERNESSMKEKRWTVEFDAQLGTDFPMDYQSVLEGMKMAFQFGAAKADVMLKDGGPGHLWKNRLYPASAGLDGIVLSASGHAQYSFHSEFKAGGLHETVSESGSGTFQSSDFIMIFGIQPVTKQYLFSIVPASGITDPVTSLPVPLGIKVRGLKTRIEKESFKGEITKDDSSHTLIQKVIGIPGWTNDTGGEKPHERIPIAGRTLSGSYSKITKPHAFGATELSMTWNFRSGGVPDHELIVKMKGLDRQSKEVAYAKWIPEGGQNSSQKANGMIAEATLVHRKTKQPATPKLFRFELINGTSVPGVCMNSPRTADTDFNNFDLRFVKFLEEKILDQPRCQRAEVPGRGSTAGVLIGSFDRGGATFLRVTAEMADGEIIDGHLENEPSTERIPIPKRENGSLIASAWKEGGVPKGQADDWDEEDDPPNKIPECAQHKGDGLTLYEEYRGFSALNDPQAINEHIRGDPKKKDFFIVISSMMPAQEREWTRAGVGDFAKLSGLAVHGHMRTSEFDRERVVNFNHAGAPHSVDQHGVIIEMAAGNPNPVMVAESAKDRPGTPATIEAVAISYALQTDRDNFVSGILHELFHACNVWHHGFDDIGKVEWKEGKDADGNPAVIETDLETGESRVVIITDEKTGQLVQPGEYSTPKVGYVAIRGGEHSGDRNCVMRWNRAHAYCPDIPASNRRVRFRETEPPGAILCTSRQWTAPAPDRYGNARPLRGACKHQICLNDKYKDSHSQKGEK